MIVVQKGNGNKKCFGEVEFNKVIEPGCCSLNETSD